MFVGERGGLVFSAEAFAAYLGAPVDECREWVEDDGFLGFPELSHSSDLPEEWEDRLAERLEDATNEMGDYLMLLVLKHFSSTEGFKVELVDERTGTVIR
ncbi:hypothetical protein Srot_0808 [Segniliparus rotundus DSM 44985]|uniref:Uncharacterized protein n=1 Tax=Segniliparus rotundus (strain ATCC BAA-972 / CDC 1076 / CIP 108378 / DSM 44985 / JCM 13578) TaxID=640132 RepID=D6ZE07_SEGRD|nr:hypothetical protein [Segniliparus rotundus]ADG97287.1 hypothetical protein Srot_0808 [Segniliparus rotundus DSM 44985]